MEPSSIGVPPNDFDDVSMFMVSLAMESILWWAPISRLNFSFDAAGTFGTVERLDVHVSDESSWRDGSNGFESQEALLWYINSCFQIPISIYTPIVSVTTAQRVPMVKACPSNLLEPP